MGTRSCVKYLDMALRDLRRMEQSIRDHRFRQAIDQEADALLHLGQTLRCINARETRAGAGGTIGRRVVPTTASLTTKQACIQLIRVARTNLLNARRLLLLHQWEAAEDAIFATLTGRVLRCINHVRPCRRSSIG